MFTPAAFSLWIDAGVLDYAIIAIRFVVVLGIGFGAKRLLKTDLDFFLSGRSLPAWITGLRLHSREPRRPRGPGDGRQRRAVRRGHGALLLDRPHPGDDLPRPGDDAVLLRAKIRSMPEWLRRRYGPPGASV